ncbi:MAG: hypothetical protein AAF512_09095 [Pseudomonadota bacterium]
MKKSLIVSASIIGLLVSAPSFAHNGSPEKKADRLFSQFDVNQDGSITLDEVAFQRNEEFTSIDTDANGELTKEEIKAAHQQRREERRAKIQAKIDSGELPADALERKRRSGKEGGKKGRRAIRRSLKRMDENDNGTISREEYTTHLPMFDRFDCENDGVITREDILQGPCRKRGQ